MFDRDKVIKGLEHCSSGDGCKGCPYSKNESGHVCSFDCIRDALALLKDQPEIIRCRDCKRRLECDYWIENGDEWFCADGKRW